MSLKERANRKFILRKLPIRDYYFMSDASSKGRKEGEGRFYPMVCPNCFGKINGDPITTEKFDDKTNKHIASFIRVEKSGNEYKVLCCSDKTKCKAAWMKDRNCDENGVALGASKGEA